jgi:predicted PurR-regulated permease PerM
VRNGSLTAIEQWTGIAAVAVLAVICLFIVRPFASAALWAAILSYSAWPMCARLERITGGRRSLAALVSVLLLAAMFVTPFAIVGATLRGNLSDLIVATRRLEHAIPTAAPQWLAAIPVLGQRAAEYWNNVAAGRSALLENTRKLLPTAVSIAFEGGKMLAAGTIQIALSLLIAFFFFRDGDVLAERLEVMIGRIGADTGRHLLAVAGETIDAVVRGVLGTALVQGVLAGIGFLIAGVPGAAFLGFVTFLVSVLPGGPPLVAAPAALWLYLRGWLGWAIFIMIWGLMVGAIDNVVKPLLIGRGSAAPIIIIMLGVIGGALAFGLIGVFIGPTLLAVAYTLLDEWSSGAGVQEPIAADDPPAGK